MLPDWVATTLDVLRNHPTLQAHIAASQILARYAQPGDPPRLVTVVPAGGEMTMTETLLRARIDVRCWAEGGETAFALWRLVHQVLTDHVTWLGRRMTRWRLQSGPVSLADPEVALVQVYAVYESLIYGEQVQ